MPWKRAKALGPPELGMELFAQAGRIQREASEAAGRYIPMIQENVRGAQKYVGRAQWHYGSYYLWGDVPALMPITHKGGVKVPGMSWSGSDQPGYKAVAFNDPRHAGTKNSGGSWFNVAHNTTSGTGNNARDVLVAEMRGPRGGKVRHDPRYPHLDPKHPEYSDGTKQPGISGVRANGKGDRWFQDGAAASGSKSSARKAASARIAKIPFPLAQHIARVYRNAPTAAVA